MSFRVSVTLATEPSCRRNRRIWPMWSGRAASSELMTRSVRMRSIASPQPLLVIARFSSGAKRSLSTRSPQRPRVKVATASRKTWWYRRTSKFEPRDPRHPRNLAAQRTRSRPSPDRCELTETRSRTRSQRRDHQHQDPRYAGERQAICQPSQTPKARTSSAPRSCPRRLSTCKAEALDEQGNPIGEFEVDDQGRRIIGKVGDITFVSAKADPAKLFGEWSEHQKALDERRAQQGK